MSILKSAGMPQNPFVGYGFQGANLGEAVAVIVWQRQGESVLLPDGHLARRFMYQEYVNILSEGTELMQEWEGSG